MNVADGSHVTICVPVCNGAAFVAETLASIQRQSHRDITVLVSDDASDDDSMAACRPFARDPRFRLAAARRRGGWIGNCNRLLARADGEFVCIVPHDDILDARYIEALLAALADAPDCVMAFTDIQVFGLMDDVYRQDSISGGTAARVQTFIASHWDGTAFRGLLRHEALQAAGGLRGNAMDNFAADVAWLGRIAHVGGLRRVPQPLYRKRRHALSVSLQWKDWSDETRAQAWALHCGELLRDALELPLRADERKAIVRATVRRLLAVEPARPFGFIRELPRERQGAMVAGLLDGLEHAAGAIDALADEALAIPGVDAS